MMAISERDQASWRNSPPSLRSGGPLLRSFGAFLLLGVRPGSAGSSPRDLSSFRALIASTHLNFLRLFFSQFENHDRVVLVRKTLRVPDEESVLVVLQKFNLPAILEKRGRFDLLRHLRHCQHGVRPVQDVQVDLVAFARRYAPRTRRERAAARAVNRFTVLFEPCANLFQPVYEFRLDFTTRRWADI